MTIRKKLYLMLFFVLFVIVAMTAVTYIRSRAAIMDLVDSAGMDTVRASAKARTGRKRASTRRGASRTS